MNAAERALNFLISLGPKLRVVPTTLVKDANPAVSNSVFRSPRPNRIVRTNGADLTRAFGGSFNPNELLSTRTITWQSIWFGLDSAGGSNSPPPKLEFWRPNPVFVLPLGEEEPRPLAITHAPVHGQQRVR